MPTKRAAPRRRAVVSKQDRFSGLTGAWKSIAAFGVIGCMAATNMYSALVSGPAAQKEHVSSVIAIQNEFTKSIEARSQAAYAHGEKAVERLATSIEKVGEKFGTVQSTTQSKQDLIRQGIEETNAILRSQHPTQASADLPEWVPVKPRPPKKIE